MQCVGTLQRRPQGSKHMYARAAAAVEVVVVVVVVGAAIRCASVVGYMCAQDSLDRAHHLFSLGATIDRWRHDDRIRRSDDEVTSSENQNTSSSSLVLSVFVPLPSISCSR
jgi:hypothetical protein